MDPEVCSVLFNSCIKGLLFEKTVVLVTHQTHFVNQADKVLIIEDGQQIFFGNYEKLIQQGFTGYLGKITQVEVPEKESKPTTNETIKENPVAVKDKKSIIEEEMSKGTIPLKIYFKYALLGYKNWFNLALAVLIQIIAQVSYLSLIFWIVI